MTSTADTTPHPDVSEIAELTEDLLPAARETSIRQHLRGCVMCTEVQDSLSEVRDLLGNLPTPQQMPSDIAGRIDAALAAEAPSNRTMTDGPARVSRETSPGFHSGSTPSTGPTGRPRTGAGPVRSRSVRWRRRRTMTIGAAFGAAVIGMGVFFLQTSPSGNDTSSTARRAADSAAPTFTEPDLQSRVHSLLATKSGTPTASAPQQKNAPSVHMDSSPNGLERGTDTTVPSCVVRGIGRHESPLAAQQGTYNGSAAYLVVLPYPSDSDRVQAYVVDASCVDATPPAPGTILLKHTYPRG